MPIPDIRRRSGSLLLALAAGHIVLISAQVNTRSGVPVLQAFVFGVFAEVQRGTTAVVGGVRRAWEEYAALKGVHADNLALKQEIRELQVSMQRERALAGEAESLRRLLDLRDRSQMPTVAAEVIGTSPAADFRSVVIDRGTSDGVQKDMAVVSPDGAVGRVVTLSPHAAKVQLLIDRDAAVAVMVGKTRVQAIATGTADESLLKLEYLERGGQHPDGRRRRDVRDRRPLSGGVRGRARRADRAGGRPVPIGRRPARGGLLRARARAGGDGAPRLCRGRARGEEAMSAVRVAAFVFAALVLQTTLARYLVRGSVGVDLVLVVVVYVSLKAGPTVGMLTGTVAGLMQDSLMTGIVGIGSLGKTLVGYLAGIVGRAFIVTQPVPRFLVFVAATLLEMTVITGLRVVVTPGPASVPAGAIVAQAFGNALVGIVLFQLTEARPRTVDRQRQGRRVEGQNDRRQKSEDRTKACRAAAVSPPILNWHWTV